MWHLLNHLLNHELYHYKLRILLKNHLHLFPNLSFSDTSLMSLLIFSWRTQIIIINITILIITTDPYFRIIYINIHHIRIICWLIFIIVIIVIYILLYLWFSWCLWLFTKALTYWINRFTSIISTFVPS